MPIAVIADRRGCRLSRCGSRCFPTVSQSRTMNLECLLTGSVIWDWFLFAYAQPGNPMKGISLEHLQTAFNQREPPHTFPTTAYNSLRVISPLSNPAPAQSL
jgi:hypothetical protein